MIVKQERRKRLVELESRPSKEQINALISIMTMTDEEIETELARLERIQKAIEIGSN